MTPKRRTAAPSRVWRHPGESPWETSSYPDRTGPYLYAQKGVNVFWRVWENESIMWWVYETRPRSESTKNPTIIAPDFDRTSMR